MNVTDRWVCSATALLASIGLHLISDPPVVDWLLFLAGLYHAGRLARFIFAPAGGGSVGGRVE